MRCGEVRDFVTRQGSNSRRSSCIKRRNIAVCPPLVLSKRAAGRARVCCWMAGGMQPAHPDPGARNPAQDPSRRSSLGRQSGGGGGYHRLPVTSERHVREALKCQNAGQDGRVPVSVPAPVSMSPECPGLRPRELDPTAWLLARPCRPALHHRCLPSLTPPGDQQADST